MARKTGVTEVAARPYWREAEARTVVEAWRNSGESLSGFARRHGVDPGRVARWAARLERASTPVRFHPVRLARLREHDDGGGAAIEIHLVGGQRVRVAPGFQAEDLRRVLAVLQPGTPC
jgi:hypothetical protein